VVYKFFVSCPKSQEKAKVNLTKEDTYCYLTWEEYKASIFTTRAECVNIQKHTVDKAVHVTRELKSTDVLLDNQADISIIHPCLLTDVKPAKKKIRVSGVGGVQLIVDKVGLLDVFFEVYSSTETKVNVLSMAAVEEVYPITYNQQESFIVHTEDRDIEFKWRDRLYVEEWTTEGVALATIQANELLYTKEEVCRAKLAYEFVRSSGYPSPEEVVHLLIDGNVRGIPKLMVADVKRTYEIYGQHPEFVKGQLNEEESESRAGGSGITQLNQRFKIVSRCHAH
jgi:hypothetical protein